MKTLEFKLDLNQRQQAKIDNWLDVMTWLWNAGLGLLNWREYWLSLNECNYRPKDKKTDDLVKVPDSTLKNWGFCEWDAIPLVTISEVRNELTYKLKKKEVTSVAYYPASERVITQKININNYRSFKAGEYTEHKFDKKTIYLTPELTPGQFIECKETKKGIAYYLCTPGIRENKPHWRDEPPIAGFHYFDLSNLFTKTNIRVSEVIPDDIKERIEGIPSKIINSQLKNVGQTWDKYKKHKIGKPHFKNRQHETVKTLYDGNAAIREDKTEEEIELERLAKEEHKRLVAEAKAKGEKPPKRVKEPKKELTGSNVKINGNRVRLPLFGEIVVKGLEKRWGNKFPINYRITKHPSGYYLQLVGNFPPSIARKINLNKEPGKLKAIGIDAGVVCLYADDAGRQVKPHKVSSIHEKRKIRLQRKLARQKNHSNNSKDTKLKIALLEEKNRRLRKASDHKLTTKLVREYDGIAVEKLNLKGMVKSSKTKAAEEGVGYGRNRRAQKSGLNKALLRNSPGRRAAMIETKVNALNEHFEFNVREFVKVPSQNSSRECRVCGYTDKANRTTQASFKCIKCTHTEHADLNASRVILKRGREIFVRSYRSWEWEVKPVSGAIPISVGDVPMGEILVTGSMRQEVGAQVTYAHNTTTPQAEICAEICTAEIRPAAFPKTVTTTSKNRFQNPKKQEIKYLNLSNPEPSQPSKPPAQPAQHKRQHKRNPNLRNNPSLGIQLELNLWGDIFENTS